MSWGSAPHGNKGERCELRVCLFLCVCVGKMCGQRSDFLNGGFVVCFPLELSQRREGVKGEIEFYPNERDDMEWIRMGEGDGIGVPSRECEFPKIDILNPALSID